MSMEVAADSGNRARVAQRNAEIRCDVSVVEAWVMPLALRLSLVGGGSRTPLHSTGDAWVHGWAIPIVHQLGLEALQSVT